MGRVDLNALTWTELERHAQDDSAVALLPLGAHEQHGPHLPFGTDTFIAERVAATVADMVVEPVLVWPCVPVGDSSHHTGFPGTATLNPGVCESLVRCHARSVAAWGGRSLAVFSHHGGNYGSMNRAVAALRAELPELDIQSFADLDRYLAVEADAARTCGISLPETDVHAGAIETSLMLHLMPAAVRPFANLTGYTEAEEGWFERMMSDGVHSVDPRGVLGDPSLASARAGQVIFDAICEELASWLCRAFGLRPVRRDE